MNNKREQHNTPIYQAQALIKKIEKKERKKTLIGITKDTHTEGAKKKKEKEKTEIIN